MYSKLRHVAVYSLFAVLFAIAGFSSALGSEYDLKVDEKTVAKIETLMKSSNVPLSGQNPDEMEKLFRSRSSAHRLRLSQIYLEVSKDKNFLKQFPEFKPLVDQSGKTVRALLEHDVAKGHEVTKPAIRILSMLQGFDFRNPNPNVTAEVDDQLRKVLKDAIDDINTVDKKVMVESLKKISPSADWARKHEALTDALDLYDTYKSRQDELAKNGRKLSPPSEWIEKLEKEGAYSAEQKQANDLKKRFARYLETTDPLKDPSRFAKADDFIKISGSNYAQDIENIFDRKKTGLKGRAILKDTGAKAKVGGKNVASTAKAGVGVQAAISGVEYFVDPDSVSAEGVVTDFFMVGNTSDCDTFNCYQFVKQCAAKLKMKDLSASAEVVFKNPQSKVCIDDFFRLPLEEQAEQRKDGNLNRLLSGFTPSIRHLSCQKEGGQLVVQLDTVKTTPNGLEAQKVSFDGTGAIQTITRKAMGEDRLFAGGSGAQSLQHCKSGKDCRIYEMKQVRSERLYFFKDDSFPAVSKNSPYRMPIDSFRWARSHEGLIKFQAESLHDCCQRESCQKYFVDSGSSSRKIASPGVAGAR